MEISKLENGIMELLPQVPFVLDQVDSAIKWVKEELPEGEYYQALKLAFNVATFASSISDPNFFKTHLVIASLLNHIPNVQQNEKFKMFDTASKVVEKTLNRIHVKEDLIKERGCFKALLLQLVPVANEDQESLTVMFYGILGDLQEIVAGMESLEAKAPITQKDYITILGYSYVICNLYLSNLNLYEYSRKVLNEINIILNTLKY